MVLEVDGPAVVDDVMGAIVKFVDVMAAPVDEDVVAPGTEVDAAGDGPPVVVFDKTLLLVELLAGAGAPVTTGAPATPGTMLFVAVFGVVTE